MNKTHVVKEKKPNWHFIDAENQTLGRLASDIAKLLIGKHKENFSYRVNVGDKVVVTNTSKLRVTGNKLKDKKYRWHTGYPGGLKEESLEGLLSRNPERVIEQAVKGMLPKNKLQRERMRNLYVYAGPTHPHMAQEK
ncbi:50S ribosomal protein L13 [Patescibacteria group bacterium]|nr:50S ribosomal protein L13 [Patescibacteria group bacterium]